MKDRRFVCLLCRHNSIQNPVGSRYRRWKSTGEPFVLPRLVIDLDAAGNKNVKSFDELSKTEQKSHLQAYSDSNLRRQLPRAAPYKIQYGKRLPSWSTFGQDRNRTTPPDLLSYALLGEDNKTYMGKIQRAEVSQQLGVRLEERMLRNVQEVASTFVIDDLERMGVAGFNFGSRDEIALKEKIEMCHNLDSLQQIISIISSTREGCSALLRNSSAIVESIRKSRKRQNWKPETASPGKVLRLLNNLRLKLDAVGMSFNSTLCSKSLYYAAKALSLPALRMYIGMAERAPNSSAWHSAYSTVQLACSLLDLDNVSELTPRQLEMQKRSITKILTGHEDESAISLDETQDLSIRKLLGGPNRIDSRYCAYLCTLGQLGLKQALSQEWKLLTTFVDAPDTAIASKNAMLPFHVFAIAFSLAGDSGKALEILKKAPDASPESSLGDNIPTPDMRNWHYVKKLSDLIVSHYKCLNLQGTQSLFENMKSDFRNLPHDPEAALIVLERYLIPEYRRGTQLRLLEVKDFMNRQVLLVVPVNGGGRPLHAKVLKLRDGSFVAEESDSLLDKVDKFIASGGAERVG